MTTIEIVLIIIGFICICVSFFAAKKKSEHTAEEVKENQSSSLWTEREEEKIKERVNEILSERQNELIDSTEDKMNRLCNDKIMAVDEFSQQILEKIDSNHQEVVFMYNMLNEKEKELKEMMTKPVRSQSVQHTKEVQKTASQTAISRLTASAQMSDKKENLKKTEAKKVVKKENETNKMPSVMQDDVNAKIKKMHQQGKSVLEISKALNIGQGEVKLILALYGGSNK